MHGALRKPDNSHSQRLTHAIAVLYRSAPIQFTRPDEQNRRLPIKCVQLVAFAVGTHRGRLSRAVQVVTVFKEAAADLRKTLQAIAASITYLGRKHRKRHPSGLDYRQVRVDGGAPEIGRD